MKTKVAMLIIGLFVIAVLPTTAFCEDEITEAAVTIEDETTLTADLEADDTGPPFLAEIYAAINAGDALLQTEIDSEEAARLAADAALQTEIASEEAFRIAEDEALWAAINDAIDSWMADLAAESSARASADEDLQNQIDEINDILNEPSSPPPGVSFGNLVIETEYYDGHILRDFVRYWLDGYGTTADATLIFKNNQAMVIREIRFTGLRPTLYYTMDSDHTEHFEFSVEYVDIGNGNDEFVYSGSFDFAFNGHDIYATSVKPPEIYFSHLITDPQFFHGLPIISSSPNENIVISEVNSDEDYWQLVSGADMDIEYVDGNISEVKGGDVVLTGLMQEKWIVDEWVRSWIDDFDNAFPEDIIIRYQNPDMDGGHFVDAMPTSYILPSVARGDPSLAKESLSFTYLDVIE